MTKDLIQIKTGKTAVRIVLLVLLLLAFVWSFFVIRWYLGNTLAEYFNPAENSIDVSFSERYGAHQDFCLSGRVGCSSIGNTVRC